MGRTGAVPTIKDVALAAGVSVGTVSRYLNGGNARPQNAERIEDAVASLGYRPNALGRYLVTGRSRSVGVLVPNAANVFAATILSGLQLAFEKQGYTALFMDYRQSSGLLERKVDVLLSRSVDGLVVLTSEMRTDEYEFLADVGVPLVVLDNPLEAAGVESVIVDNRTAARELVGSMLDAGHERVGIICMSRSTYVGEQRYLGWADALEERGLSVHAEDVCEVAASKREGRDAMDVLLARGQVTGVYASNYYLTLGVLRALAERGLSAGVDVGFASFDDFDFGDVLLPPLSTVAQPTGAMARMAADLLVQQMAGPSASGGTHVLRSEVSVTPSVAGGLGGAVTSFADLASAYI